MKQKKTLLRNSKAKYTNCYEICMVSFVQITYNSKENSFGGLFHNSCNQYLHNIVIFA